MTNATSILPPQSQSPISQPAPAQRAEAAVVIREDFRVSSAVSKTVMARTNALLKQVKQGR